MHRKPAANEMNLTPPRKRPAFRRAGITMIEIIVSTTILAAIATIALPTVRQLYDSQMDSADLSQAHLLARDLMQEILARDYQDPPGDLTTTGIRTRRGTFDSIDDYADWNSSGNIAPQLKDGTLIPLGTGWVRQVRVEFIDPVDPGRQATADAGIKRVHVTVSRLGTELVNYNLFVTE